MHTRFQSTRASSIDEKRQRSDATFLEPPFHVPTSSKELYKLINKVERAIGGDSGLIGVAGSIARLDLTAIFTSMGLSHASCLLDVGSGLGRPMLHALISGVSAVCGVEFDPVKHRKAQTVISRVLPVEYQVRTSCQNVNVLDVQSLDELDDRISHIFSFWEGIDTEARLAVARLVTHNWTTMGNIQSVAFVQAGKRDIVKYMAELGFPSELALVDSFQVAMIGGASRFRAYIFRFPNRVGHEEPARFCSQNAVLSTIEATGHISVVKSVDNALSLCLDVEESLKLETRQDITITTEHVLGDTQSSSYSITSTPENAGIPFDTPFGGNPSRRSSMSSILSEMSDRALTALGADKTLLEFLHGPSHLYAELGHG